MYLFGASDRRLRALGAFSGLLPSRIGGKLGIGEYAGEFDIRTRRADGGVCLAWHFFCSDYHYT